MAKPEKLAMREPLLLRSIGAFGRLKPPHAFTERFPYNRKTVPDPEAFCEDVDGEIRLTYVWKRDELEQNLLSVKPLEEEEEQEE